MASPGSSSGGEWPPSSGLDPDGMELEPDGMALEMAADGAGLGARSWINGLGEMGRRLLAAGP